MGRKSKRHKPKASKALDAKNLGTLTNPDDVLLALFSMSASASGVAVNTATAMGVATVYSCVNIISRYIAKLPLHIYRRDDDKREKATDFPLYHVLHSSANAYQTSFDFRMQAQANLSLRANSYIRKVRSSRGQIVGLESLPASDIVVDMTSGEPVYRHNHGSGTKDYAAKDIVHLRGLGFSGLCGVDPLFIGKDIIGLAIALDDNASKFFANSSRPGAVLEAPKGVPDATYQKLKDAFDTQIQGDNAFKTVILEHGLKLAASRMSNDQSQFDQTRERQAVEIARFFGVPGHKVGISGNIPRANVQEQNIEFITDTIGPIAVLWEQALTKFLLTPSQREEFFIEFDLNGALRGNSRDRAEFYKTGRQWGYLSSNDIRRLENMPTIGPDGDRYLEPMNMGLPSEKDASQSAPENSDVASSETEPED